MAAMLRPMTMFCCGCSPAAGVQIVLFFHFIACFFQLASVCANIIFDTPLLFEHDSMDAQLFIAGLSLVGIPIIIAASYGVTLRVEANIRLYLYYLSLCFVIDTVAVIYWCLIENICTSKVFEDVMDGDAGESFMCGLVQVASYFVAAGAVAVEVYILWLVWSVCENIHLGTNGPELSGLIRGKDDVIHKNRRAQDGPYAGIVGFAHTKVPGPYPYPDGAPYGSTLGMPGQPAMFGGTFHDTSYPPKKDGGAA